MKLPAMLLKAGLASAGAGIYLSFKRLFKRKKKTKKEIVKKVRKPMAAKKPSIKPRKKRLPALES
jgi:hypothetical protein